MHLLMRSQPSMHRFFQRFPVSFFAKVKACIETACMNIATRDCIDMLRRARECRLFSAMNGGHDGVGANSQWS
jgi:hypothetical protein